MLSPISNERSYLPSPKRQKLEAKTIYDDDEALELFNQEIRKNQMPQTNRDLIALLSKQALFKYNAEQKTCFELCKILRANFHQSAGFTFYISFLVNDPCNGNQTKPYRAVVYQHFAGDIRVRSCNPKPPSSSA